jgi:hypothetical protein
MDRKNQIWPTTKITFALEKMVQFERGQLFSAFRSFFKNWQQSPKVEQFFSATKMSENARVLAALDCTKHQFH